MRKQRGPSPTSGHTSCSCFSHTMTSTMSAHTHTHTHTRTAEKNQNHGLRVKSPFQHDVKSRKGEDGGNLLYICATREHQKSKRKYGREALRGGRGARRERL
ncbi:hypothetical protein BCV70DRAFT_94954 [Testicularia cyperi]|uniref:Uncharacterized protein n=1 Tax=Testicularia cyperi TaxID=1882483 RepID=A0A317XQ18_9BASI|nr:hypothetical protein BCV70DRAFT_94954 [Testicularia cyperi]